MCGIFQYILKFSDCLIKVNEIVFYFDNNLYADIALKKVTTNNLFIVKEDILNVCLPLKFETNDEA